jgi:hypothetical protein
VISECPLPPPYYFPLLRSLSCFFSISSVRRETPNQFGRSRAREKWKGGKREVGDSCPSLGEAASGAKWGAPLQEAPVPRVAGVRHTWCSLHALEAREARGGRIAGWSPGVYRCRNRVVRSPTRMAMSGGGYISGGGAGAAAAVAAAAAARVSARLPSRP